MKAINRVMGWRAGSTCWQGWQPGEGLLQRLRPEPVLSPEDREEAATPRQEAEQTHSTKALGQPCIWLMC